MIEAQVDLTNPAKAKAFVRWARTNKIEYSIPDSGYIVGVKFNNVFEVLRWL
jgi:hypothetical protein